MDGDREQARPAYCQLSRLVVKVTGHVPSRRTSDYAPWPSRCEVFEVSRHQRTLITKTKTNVLYNAIVVAIHHLCRETSPSALRFDLTPPPLFVYPHKPASRHLEHGAASEHATELGRVLLRVALRWLSLEAPAAAALCARRSCGRGEGSDQQPVGTSREGRRVRRLLCSYNNITQHERNTAQHTPTRDTYDNDHGLVIVIAMLTRRALQPLQPLHTILELFYA